jgi:predicted transcriptional regulator
MKKILASVLLASLLGGPALAPAQDAPKAAPDKADQAINRAIDYLISVQDKDGAIHDANHNLTAMTSLAIMAMAVATSRRTRASRAPR